MGHGSRCVGEHGDEHLDLTRHIVFFPEVSIDSGGALGWDVF